MELNLQKFFFNIFLLPVGHSTAHGSGLDRLQTYVRLSSITHLLNLRKYFPPPLVNARSELETDRIARTVTVTLRTRAHCTSGKSTVNSEIHLLKPSDGRMKYLAAHNNM